LVVLLSFLRIWILSEFLKAVLGIFLYIIGVFSSCDLSVSALLYWRIPLGCRAEIRTWDLDLVDRRVTRYLCRAPFF
jgi:hypothetical protein